MKIRSVLAIALGVVLSCGIAEAQQRQQSQKPSAEQYYNGAVDLHSITMSNILDSTMNAYKQYAGNPDNPVFRDNALRMNQLLITHANAWKKIPEHPAHRKFHQAYNKAMGRLWKIARKARTEINNKNAETIRRAAQLLNDGKTRFENALELRR